MTTATSIERPDQQMVELQRHNSETENTRPDNETGITTPPLPLTVIEAARRAAEVSGYQREVVDNPHPEETDAKMAEAEVKMLHAE